MLLPLIQVICCDLPLQVGRDLLHAGLPRYVAVGFLLEGVVDGDRVAIGRLRMVGVLGVSVQGVLQGLEIVFGQVRLQQPQPRRLFGSGVLLLHRPRRL